MRDFDPVRLGEYEADAWVTYYQRRWGAFLRAAVGMVRVGFGMPWPATIRGAWRVLRANQAWAPFPDNDPERARVLMRDFYRDVVHSSEESFDPDRAATLELNWWAAHRQMQHGDADKGVEPLVDALTELYPYVYSAPAAAVRPAAQGRAEAMRTSDQWVADGKDPASPAIAAERAELVASYTLLRDAIRVAP